MPEDAQKLLDVHAKFTKYQKMVVLNYNGVRKIVDVELVIRDDGDKVEVVDCYLIKE